MNYNNFNTEMYEFINLTLSSDIINLCHFTKNFVLLYSYKSVHSEIH